MAERIYLVGLSGSGKSTAGRLVADRLGWDFVDTDVLIEDAAGRTIPAIFEEDGEPAFRAREVEALRETARRDRLVVATGGGAPTTGEGRDLIAGGFSVWLRVSPEAAAKRLATPGGEERPLLAGGAEARLADLLEQRRDVYAAAAATVDVDGRTAEAVAREVVRLWEAHAEGERFGPGVAAVVRTPGATYPVIVRAGALADLGGICRRAGLRGRAFVISDANVADRYGEGALAALREAGYAASLRAFPAGEQHKTMETVAGLHDWLLGERVERSDFAVCLGGGVATDLGGFVAATCLRGIPFVHVPTTTLGMVDAAVGGKTGVDHVRGKNLIGAFAQPSAVVIDPELLATLPERELRAGLAEVVKHGFILDEDLTCEMERRAGDDPRALVSPEIIARSVAIKARVVSADEREAGERTLLNYGHTIGHAIEAVTGYTDYLHGEAVAVGMHAAARIAEGIGLLAPEQVVRQQALLRALGLPERAPGLDLEPVLEATRSDKKVRAGTISWVLLERLGQATVRRDVPDEAVQRAASAVLE